MMKNRRVWELNDEVWASVFMYVYLPFTLLLVFGYMYVLIGVLGYQFLRFYIV